MMTTYCTHRYRPTWRVGADGIGHLECATCGAPVVPPPTREVGTAEVVVLFLALLVTLAGFGAWFWWTWVS
jgi:hypothetical protein